VTWTRVGIVGGVLVLALVIFLVALGSTALRAPLIALVALVVLVAGGNWLNDWLGIKRKPQQFNRPDRTPKEPDEQ
jgi:hypothetical protein